MQTEARLKLTPAARGTRVDWDWQLTIMDERSKVTFVTVDLTNSDIVELFSQRGTRLVGAAATELDHVGRYQAALQLILPVDRERQGSAEWQKRQAERALQRWYNGAAEIACDGTTGWEYDHVDGDGKGRRHAVYYRWYSDEERPSEA